MHIKIRPTTLTSTKIKHTLKVIMSNEDKRGILSEVNTMQCSSNKNIHFKDRIITWDAAVNGGYHLTIYIYEKERTWFMDEALSKWICLLYKIWNVSFSIFEFRDDFTYLNFSNIFSRTQIGHITHWHVNLQLIYENTYILCYHFLSNRSLKVYKLLKTSYTCNLHFTCI